MPTRPPNRPRLLARHGSDTYALKADTLESWLTGEGLATIDANGGLHVTAQAKNVVDALRFLTNRGRLRALSRCA